MKIEYEELSPVELEWRLVYSLIVAGKSATFANGVVEKLHEIIPDGISPIARLAYEAPTILKRVKSGRYRVLTNAFFFLNSLFSDRLLDLETCEPEELEEVPGIGMKTSRFFVVWTRPGAKVAVLDRHVLRWLKGLGYNVPDNSPTGRRYLEIEKIFLELAEKWGMTPRELDYKIWIEAAGVENVA